MSELFDRLKPHMERYYAFQAALSLLNWDNSTLAPPEAIGNTSRAIGTLSGECYGAIINDEVMEILEGLAEPKERQKLSEYEQRIVKDLTKKVEWLKKIPPEEYQAYSALLARAYPVWEQAKGSSDYASFAPVLKEIFSYQKRFAGYRRKEEKELYDVELNDFEEGFTVEILDEFFGKLRAALSPLVEKIRGKQEAVSDACLHQEYDIEGQKKLGRFLAEHLGFDFGRGVLAESEHPFTTSWHNRDVRMTTHYVSDNVVSSIFSVIHESGHALYEMGIDDEITMTPIGNGTSMGMHESQSRLYENNIGRSMPFWKPIYGRVQEMFPGQLGDVTLEEFCRAINKSEPSLIRIEADELTYPFHVMIRYEIEKMVYRDEATVEELPAIWNRMYREYLGVEPDSDANGILQDMHWAGGSVGYFPSYALGSAIAAQICHHLQDALDFRECLETGSLAPIREYLREHIHKYGGARNTRELLRGMTGEDFNPDYYIAYLTEKYAKLYQV